MIARETFAEGERARRINYPKAAEHRRTPKAPRAKPLGKRVCLLRGSLWDESVRRRTFGVGMRPRIAFVCGRQTDILTIHESPVTIQFFQNAGVVQW